jgi:hypothetical protein
MHNLGLRFTNIKVLSLLEYASDELIPAEHSAKAGIAYLKLDALADVPNACPYGALLSLAEKSKTNAILEFAEAAECAFRRVLR